MSSKRPEIVAAVLSALKTSHPTLTLGQRTTIASKFADSWQFGDAVPGADEIAMHLMSWPASNPAMFRPVPSVDAVLAHLSVNIDNVNQRLLLAHEVQSMTEDQRLAAVPFVKGEPSTPPVQESKPASRQTLRERCLAHASNFDSLSPQERRRIACRLEESPLTVPDTVNSVKRAGRETLSPTERINAARGM